MGDTKIRQDATFMGSVTVTSDISIESISATSKLTSTKLLTASSKSTLTKAVTASSDLTVTKSLTASSGFSIPLTVAATSNTIPGVGLTHITNASTVKTYNLATATTGAVAYITAISMATTDLGAKVVPATTTVVFLSSAGSTGRQALFGLNGDRITLVGNTSGNWIVTSNNGVVFSGS